MLHLYSTCSRIDRHVLAKDHRSCKLECCTYEKIDYTTYRPIHTSAGCCCAHVTPGYESWKRMDLLLCKGGIPLITFMSNDSFGSQLRVQAFLERNMESSTLPSRTSGLTDSAIFEKTHYRPVDTGGCKVKSSLDPARRANIPFWIDTICVPREMVTRTLAIKRMRDVYSRLTKFSSSIPLCVP